jgi:hypothetical protein
VLTNRLAPKLGELVHVSQSAFIKGRFIHGSLKLVQASAKQLNGRRVFSLLLKVDIARAFDSVSWPFLMQVLHAMGFSRVWRDWISALLLTASTKIMLNETSSARVYHTCGLHQGDLLSPMLFLLVMEVLGAMFRRADAWSLLQSLSACPILHCVPLYVDDMVMFLAARHQDLQVAWEILQIFEDASGLGCNMGSVRLPQSVAQRSRSTSPRPSSHAKKWTSQSITWVCPVHHQATKVGATASRGLHREQVVSLEGENSTSQWPACLN